MVNDNFDVPGAKKKKKNVHRRLETMSELQVNYKEGKQDSFSTI